MRRWPRACPRPPDWRRATRRRTAALAATRQFRGCDWRRAFPSRAGRSWKQSGQRTATQFARGMEKDFSFQEFPKQTPATCLRLLPAAVFVFLAAAAGAWAVAADFRAGADGVGLGLGFHRLRGFADHVAGFGLSAAGSGAGAAERAGVLVQGLLRRVAEKIFKRHQARRAAEDVVADLRFHVNHQFVENLERFGLVFEQRIALAVGAQADAVAQAVHLVKMFLPQFVNRLQDGVTLYRHQFFRLLETDLQLVSLADGVADEIAHGKLRLAQAVEQRAGHGFFLAGFGGLDDFGFGQAEWEIQIHPVGQRTDFPFAHIFDGSKFLHFQDHNLLDDVHEAVAHVVVVDDFVAETVDDFALLVHHVVVFERAFALLEIMAFDAFLRLLDGTVKQTVLEFLAFFEAHLLHQFHNAVGTEQPHQIVFERNEKVRRTRIALARTTAAQLAVNAAGLMAFRAEDVQAAVNLRLRREVEDTGHRTV